MIKDKIKAVFVFLILCGLVGGAFYTVANYDKNDKPQVESYCGSIVYFNKETHKLDTTYGNVETYKDSIVRFFSPYDIWPKEEIISETEDEVEGRTIYDITISNGEHFKIKVIASGMCQPKIVMDSIRNSQDDEPENN